MNQFKLSSNELLQNAQGKAFGQIKRNGAPEKNTKLSPSDLWRRESPAASGALPARRNVETEKVA